MRRPAVLLALAITMLVLPPPVAGAQTPGKPDVPAATRTVNLTLEQRHVIRELIADMKIKQSAAGAKVAVGDAVPQQAELHPIPPLIGQKVPQIKSHRFYVTEQQVVLVEPKENRVAEVIE